MRLGNCRVTRGSGLGKETDLEIEVGVEEELIREIYRERIL